MSLCAPFLAFDPVMQFVVGTCVVPLTCAWFNMGCDELKASIPLYHIMAVATVASGAFALGRAGNRERMGAKDGKNRRAWSREMLRLLLDRSIITRSTKIRSIA